MLQKILCHTVVQIREGRVDHQIQVFSLEQIPIIGINLAAGILLQCQFPTGGIPIHYGNHIYIGITLTEEKLTVNIPAASSLSDDGCA